MGTDSTLATASGWNTIAVPMTVLPLKTSMKFVVPLPSVTVFVMSGVLALAGDTIADFAGAGCDSRHGGVRAWLNRGEGAID